MRLNLKYPYTVQQPKFTQVHPTPSHPNGMLQKHMVNTKIGSWRDNPEKTINFSTSKICIGCSKIYATACFIKNNMCKQFPSGRNNLRKIGEFSIAKSGTGCPRTYTPDT
jgi:hypothetical protein